jgi:hypothetical protein
VILTMTTSDTLPVRFNRVVARLFAAMFCLGLFAAAEAFAQRGIGPPRPEKPDEPPVYLYYGVLLVLGLLTIGVSLIPSKRGHLD